MRDSKNTNIISLKLNDPAQDRDLIELFFQTYIYPLKDSKVFSSNDAFTLATKDGQVTVKLSHDLHFVALSNPSSSQGAHLILSDLVTQELEHIDQCQKNNFRLLPYTLYKLKGENPSVVVLSYEIQKTARKTKKSKRSECHYSVLLDIPIFKITKTEHDFTVKDLLKGTGLKTHQLRSVVIRTHQNPDYDFRPFKYTDVTLDLTNKTIFYPETKLLTAIFESPWRFHVQPKTNIFFYKEKPMLLKTYFSFEIFNESSLLQREQHFNDLAYNQKQLKLANRSPLEIKENDTIQKAMIHIPKRSGTPLLDMDFTAFSYDEALTICIEALTALRLLYQQMGPTFVHGDLHPGNLLYNRKGANRQPLISIIDFNHSGIIGEVRKIVGAEKYNPNHKVYREIDQLYPEKLLKSEFKDRYPQIEIEKGSNTSIIRERMDRVLDTVALGILFYELLTNCKKPKGFIEIDPQVSNLIAQMKNRKLTSLQQLKLAKYVMTRERSRFTLITVEKLCANNAEEKANFQKLMDHYVFNADKKFMGMFSKDALYSINNQYYMLSDNVTLLDVEEVENTDKNTQLLLKQLIDSQKCNLKNYRNGQFYLNPHQLYRIGLRNPRYVMLSHSVTLPINQTKALNKFWHLDDLPLDQLKPAEKVILGFEIITEIQRVAKKEGMLRPRKILQHDILFDPSYSRTKPDSLMLFIDSSSFSYKPQDDSIDISEIKKLFSRIPYINSIQMPEIIESGSQLDCFQKVLAFHYRLQLKRDINLLKGVTDWICFSFELTAQAEPGKKKAIDLLRKDLENISDSLMLLNENIYPHVETLPQSIDVIVNETRQLQKSYDQYYLKLHQLIHNNKVLNPGLTDQRFGFNVKSLLAVLTRPLSLILGGIEKSLHSDVNNWYKHGFWFTRSRTWNTLQRAEERIIANMNNSVSLSPDIKETIKLKLTR